jgi:hypothetical protein
MLTLPAEEGLHVCNTMEEGWRSCPADLCEGELLLLERDDRLGEAIENLRVVEAKLERMRAERDTNREMYVDMCKQRDEWKEKHHELAAERDTCTVDYSKEDIKKAIIEFGREKVAK